MFIHNINPTIINLGPLEIRWYGLVYAVGLIIYYIYIKKLFNRLSKKYKNITKDDADILVIFMVTSMLLGSRFFHCFYYYPSYYLKHPLEFFYFWKGGMSFHGGFLFVVICGVIFARIKKIKFYELADTLILPLPILLFFGRIANFINSELIGRASNLWWCVVYPKIDNICRHPVQLYEALKNSFIFFILYFVDKYYKRKNIKNTKGKIFWLFILLYGILRFLFNFLRVDEPTLFGLDKAQWLCLIMIILASAWFLKGKKY